VKIADCKIAKSPAIITTHGLGSCLAITVYDPQMKIGGLAHVMLPEPDLVRNQSNPAKFASTAIKEMVSLLEGMGCSRVRMISKLVGGANMFSKLLNSGKTSYSNIGQRNIQQAKQELNNLGIPIVAEDTGADYGRSVEFLVSSGTVIVHSFKAGLKEL
jgi:chemotaxis protein CheD